MTRPPPDRIMIAALVLWCSAAATPVDPHVPFFDSLAVGLRADYRLCSQDTSTVSDSVLFAWKHSIDSVTESEQFPDLVRKFVEVTRLHVAEVRPCEVVAWHRESLRRQADIEKLIAEQRRRNFEFRAESTHAFTQLAKLDTSDCDIADIPFGITRRALCWLAGQRGIRGIIDSAGPVRTDSLEWGGLMVSAAFFFDQKGAYSRYELETDAYVADSLDKKVRSQAEQLASVFEKIYRRPPDHIYRIGFFDIVPGRLSLYKIWIGDHPRTYVGLATHQHLYYGKAIVWRKENAPQAGK